MQLVARPGLGLEEQEEHVEEDRAFVWRILGEEKGDLRGYRVHKENLLV